MKKRLAAAAMALSAALALSGCFPTGEKDPNVSNASNISSDTSVSFDNKHFEYSKENLTASFDIPESPNGMPARIKLKEKMFDTEEVVELFLSGKTILKKQISEEKHYWRYFTEDESILGVYSNEITFNDGETARSGFEFDAPVNYQGVVTVCEEYYRNVYFTEGNELEGFPVQNALDRALALTKKLGITNLGEPQIYAASLDTYKKFKEYGCFDWWLNDDYPLTKDNEIYVFRFSQVFGGVELANVVVEDVNDAVNENGYSRIRSPRVTVGVSKDRIFYFCAEAVYEAEYEVVNNESAKYDLNYTLSELQSCLDKTFFKERNVIYNAQPVYRPAERKESGYLEFSAAWSFEGYEADDETFVPGMYTYVVSGESGVLSRCQRK